MAGALFVGLTTLDIAYLVDTYPREDSKVRASGQFTGAGGPAANAAVTYAFLSRQAPTLVTALGSHYLTSVVRDELRANNVEVVDAIVDESAPLPISSIIVAESARTRTIVSLDASRITATLDAESCRKMVRDSTIVLVDAHYGQLASTVARQARSLGVPVVLDAGRWQDAHRDLLADIDVAICSEAFTPPGVAGHDQVISYLQDSGPTHVAITRADESILYSTGSERGEILVSSPHAIDTLGAGDIFHGAFCHYYEPAESNFVEALTRSADLASYSCGYFGTREWMKHFSAGELTRSE
ncbi:sugar/nucleoside kinase (ribokinase family) [Herbihabitans rhizosphaerae]|uniref:Sugar/nucleoside kinase (Ribokinase family) n=1 Tax=Herbihabitans rhizosphaerae TaxID=1872711 RepID=A0A4Q7KMV5_9PSEU|nr:PfkB family carbohydrate kinase [Herbihabitans rhizosphaerae]RZS36542.1 sugar/nucleoside kinase (ribokinase family) [Herbihabitans rhizosphaerae]